MKEKPPLSDEQKKVVSLMRRRATLRRKKKMSYKLVQAIKSIDVKDLLVRAGWTFVQGFLAVVLLASEELVDLLFAGSWEALYALLIATFVGAVAAGLSAVKTIVVQVIRDLKTKA